MSTFHSKFSHGVGSNTTHILNNSKYLLISIYKLVSVLATLHTLFLTLITTVVKVLFSRCTYLRNKFLS